jgi:DNA-binding response OmpR family regulator
VKERIALWAWWLIAMASILVMDDDPQIRRMVVKALATQNHTIREAENGIEGLSLLREEGADLVISDIFMPKKEGIETILEIRRIAPNTKIIAISGGGFSGRGGYLAMAEKLGADRIMQKPLRLNEFLSVVTELLRHSDIPFAAAQ